MRISQTLLETLSFLWDTWKWGLFLSTQEATAWFVCLCLQRCLSALPSQEELNGSSGRISQVPRAYNKALEWNSCKDDVTYLTGTGIYFEERHKSLPSIIRLLKQGILRTCNFPGVSYAGRRKRTEPVSAREGTCSREIHRVLRAYPTTLTRAAYRLWCSDPP